MKYYLLIFVSLFTLNLVHAQESKFSLEANYPLPIEDGFVFQNYTGIIDLGLKYRFYETNVLSLGAGINGGMLIANFNTYDTKIKTTNYIVQPKVITEFKLKNSKIHPYVSLGWSFMTFVAEGNTSSLDGEQTKIDDSYWSRWNELDFGSFIRCRQKCFYKLSV